MSLIDIHHNFGTDKGTIHSYIETYQELFAPYVDQSFNFLEVGVWLGSSLKMWHTYFPKASIYGMDSFIQKHETITKEDVFKDLSTLPRVKIIECDSKDVLAINAIMSTHLPNQTFGIIIDDGGHDIVTQISTFTWLFPYLDANGIYVIEDVSSDHMPALMKALSAFKSLKVHARCFMKGGRHDDNLIIVTHTA
jgi:hypothetical protein